MPASKDTKLHADFGASFKTFVDEFKSESDRAAVILGVARLDEMLYQLLVRRLLPNASGRDELFDGDAPLSSFSARILMAFRLGLIDAEFARALHLIRKMRNSFAHESRSATFASSGHADRIRELVLPFSGHEQFASFRTMFFEKEGVGPDFRAALALALVRLEVATARCDRLEASPCPLIPPKWGRKANEGEAEIDSGEE